VRGKGAGCRVLVSLAVLGLCAPQTLLAKAESVSPRPVVVDVALTDDGVLVGQVVNSQGTALANAPVVVWSQNHPITRVVTDERGRFAVGGLRAGVYQLATVQGHSACRLWAPGGAPPTCQKGVLLVSGHGALRGQCGHGCGAPCGAPCGPCGGPMAFWLANPWVMGGILATAIAVPVAVHNAERPSSP